MATTAAIVRTYEAAWNRLATRIRWLQDEEYLWEPVPGCWSLRLTANRRWLLDGDGGGGPTPNPVPVTTIAWRLGHLGGTLGGFARRRFGDGARLEADDLDVPHEAAAVQEFLDVHYRAWLDGLVSLPESECAQPLGPAFGPYAEADTHDLALHVLDELVHHAAEVGVLRDLWSAGLGSTPPPGAAT